MQKTKITYFRDLFNAKDTPYILTLEKCLERIKTGKYSELINKIRAEKDKTARNKLKTQLPCIMFAGEFTERSKKGLKTHSGMMVLDFDDVTEKEYRKEIETISHVITVFDSPSGNNGFKAVVNIPPCDEKTHTRYYKRFIKDFNLKFVDVGANDVSRVCYESYDEKIYINYEASVYKPVLIDEGFTIYEKPALIPINDEEEIANRIMRWGWKKDFIEGERNAFIFDIAGMFCEFGISESYATSFILNNVVHGNFTDTEVKNTIKNVYKKRSFGIRYFEDYKKVEKVKTEISRKKDKQEVIDQYAIDEQTFDEIKQDTDNDDFWAYDKNDKVKIVPNKFNNFLMRNGFRKHYRTNDDKPILVRVISNKVELTNTSKIKDFTLRYLFDLNELDVWNYIASFQNLFSENYLNMLDDIELIMLKDKRDKTYIAYENGILEITKHEKKLIDYIDIDGYIWRSHIIEREYVDQENTDNDYKQFIYNISKKEPLPMECAIGYLVNTYKNRSNNKAVILNDETISQNPEGGTGKGLFFQGIQHIRKTKIIDGKKYNNKSQYQNQAVDLDDKIIVFDDVPKNYDFESEFSLITEGLTIRKLYQNEIKLSVQESPKVAITTNYAIRGQGNAHDRRRHELEVAQHYNGDKTPFDEFGRELFEEWERNDWIRFDNYMVFCVQQFLKHGLIKQDTKNLKIRKFISETSHEFYDFCENGGVIINEYNFKDEVYNNMINEYEDYRNYKWFTRRLLHSWVEKYAKFKGYDFTGDGQSNGRRYFYLSDGTGKKHNLEDEILF